MPCSVVWGRGAEYCERRERGCWGGGVSLSAKIHVELRGETRLEGEKPAQKRDELQNLKRAESDREERWVGGWGWGAV